MGQEITNTYFDTTDENILNNEGSVGFATSDTEDWALTSAMPGRGDTDAASLQPIGDTDDEEGDEDYDDEDNDLADDDLEIEEVGATPGADDAVIEDADLDEDDLERLRQIGAIVKADFLR